MSDKMLKDLIHSLRTMRRNPGPFAVAGLTLALGIGASAAMFSVVEAVLLRPLPFPGAGQLVAVKADLRGPNMRNIGFSVLEFEDLQSRSGVFEEISVTWPMDGNLTGVDKPHRIEAMGVSAGYFDMLGAKPAMGRLFLPEDGKPWMSQSAVLSYHAWQRLFGADPNVLGRKMWLDYDPYVVVGVLPASFQHPGPTLHGEVDIWLTGCYKGGAFPAKPVRTQWRVFRAIGRLKRGLDVRQAQAQLEVFAGGIRRQYPADYPEASVWTPSIEGLQQSLVGDSRRILLFLFSGAALVLLICCVTAANLVLARTTSRSGEFAVRKALGAGRGDLVRQILVENVVLGVLSGIVALGVTAALAPVLLRAEPLKLPQCNAAGISVEVLSFAMLVAAASGILSALTPAIHVARFDVMCGLKGGGRGTGPSGNRSRAFLIAGQIALSLVLLACAGLLARSLRAVLNVDPGFRPDGVVLGYVWLPPPGNVTGKEYTKPEKRKAFVREVLRRLQTMPGVEAAAVGSGDAIPYLGWNSTRFFVEGRVERADESLAAQMTSITPDYLKVLGAKIVAGRGFNEADDGRHKVVLVNQSMARRFWGDENPIGKRIGIGPPKSPEWSEIVGVVSDMKTGGPEAAVAPHGYFPIYQRSTLAVAVMIRSSGRPESDIVRLEREIQRVDSDLAVFGLQSLNQVVARSTAQRRFALSLISIFALTALTLAGLGVYGITAFGVAQRTREIGIRIALGATRSQLLAMILGRGVLLTLAGLLAGYLGSALLTRFLAGFLFGITGADVLTYLGATVLLSAVMLLACYLPARRAARLDAARALRQE